MNRFHFDIRDNRDILFDDKGRHCANVLEAMMVAKSALEALVAEGEVERSLWIEIADEKGDLVATVRLDEVMN